MNGDLTTATTSDPRSRLSGYRAVSSFGRF